MPIASGTSSPWLRARRVSSTTSATPEHMPAKRYGPPPWAACISSRYRSASRSTEGDESRSGRARIAYSGWSAPRERLSAATFKTSSISPWTTNSGGRLPLLCNGTMAESSSHRPPSRAAQKARRVDSHITIAADGAPSYLSATCANTSAARIESPPSAKKSSSAPTRPTSSTSAHSAAISRSSGVAGSTYAACSWEAPAPVRPSSCARLRRCTFPVGPVGSSSTVTTIRGTLKSASRSATCSCRSRTLVAAPGRSTTAAPTSSPSRGSGTAKLTACVDIRVREQRVLDLRRRDLLPGAVDDLLRATSQEEVPVLVEGAFVAGPEPAVDERLGVRFRVRRRSRRRRSRRGRRSLRRRARRCRLPSPRPTDPGFRAAGGSGLLASWCAASVMPYASMTGTPNACSRARYT